jgi:hypothetical protein
MGTLEGIRKVGIAALLALAALTAPHGVNAGPAWTLDTVSNFRNSSWSFGDIFTVGGSAITVTALGAFDANLDGYITAGGIPVGIFRESDGALLASTTVVSTDPVTDHYRFHAITPLVLLAGTSYRVVAVNRDDLYNIATGTPDNVDPSITWIRYGYCNTTALTMCDAFTGTERTWMGNFIIDGSVPEPGVLSLIGLALAGLGFARKLRQ